MVGDQCCILNITSELVSPPCAPISALHFPLSYIYRTTICIICYCNRDTGVSIGRIIMNTQGFPVVAQWLTNLTRNREVEGLIPDLAQWVKDPALLWLWCRPVGTAPIQPLAWEPPHAMGVALEKTHTHYTHTHTHTHTYTHTTNQWMAYLK